MHEEITEEKVSQMSLEKLVDIIEYHDRKYWEEGEPEVSDTEYDLLLRSLRDKAPDHPLLHKVNAPSVASEGKIRHKKPMLSLDKAYSIEELMTWARKFARSNDEKFLIQPKYDGISANYENGTLATRGNGEEGENVTHKIPLVELETKDGSKYPLKNCNDTVRGEIVIRDDDFRQIYPSIKKKDGKAYKNSRNAVAGIMGLKDIGPMLAQGAKLTLVDYEKISYTVTLSEFETRWPSILAEIEALPYPMDGIVVKLADEEYSESLGSTAHHPRGQIAFKFSGVRKRTKLLDVEWSFGKNFLTPIALLEPVEMGGITIKRASLHNIKNIEDRDIKIGDTVTVERAGDVIPYIVDSEPGEDRKPCVISECPSCGSTLKREGPELLCPNPECFETKLRRLLAAVKSIGIENLGEPNVRRMMNKLNVKTLKDIFELTVDDIMSLEGFKEKSSNNLYNEIKNARNAEDYKLIAALNISGIGKNVAKSILSEYTIDELRNMSSEKLSEIEGIGPERAAAIEKELGEQSDFLDEMLGCINVKQSKGAEDTSKATICFTGKMPEKRSYYEDLARQNDYEPVSSVTKDLSLLVAADPSEKSGKLDKAREHEIKIISLEEWLQDPGSHSGSGNDNENLDGQDEADSENPFEIKTSHEDDSGFSDLPLFKLD